MNSLLNNKIVIFLKVSFIYLFIFPFPNYTCIYAFQFQVNIYLYIKLRKQIKHTRKAIRQRSRNFIFYSDTAGCYLKLYIHPSR